jgi:DUF1365 family protein
MLWLNLDELDELNAQLSWFGYNQRNIFSFYDADHFKSKNDNGESTRQKLHTFLRSRQVTTMPHKVFLLTHSRVLGHTFNPVSFYYSYNEDGHCQHVVAEVSNTFGEMKLFLIDNASEKGFQQEENKFFYVSPFTELDDRFHFHFSLPGEMYHASINVSRNGNMFFYSTLSGLKRKLKNGTLIYYFFRLPFVTLRVICGIHWQALILWLKGLKYRKKKDNKELQRDIIN